jgi:membrane associated rhomboid family serine protease
MGGLIPLGDASRRPSRFPAITFLIILMNSFVFLLELAGGDRFVYRWSAIPARVVLGHHWITLFTSMFLHGSWLHIIGNMIYLWAFGPGMEDRMGRGRYLLFYFIGGFVAMFVQVVADPHSRIPTLGASGAIAAVMGAFIVTYPRDRIRSVLIILIFVSIARIPAVLLIGFWFLIQLVDAGAVTNVGTGGVAYLAHVGGFIFGVVTARIFERPRRLAWPRDAG